jgi:hypothetical protein
MNHGHPPSITIPSWLATIFILWMLSSIPTLTGLIARLCRRKLLMATTRWFLIAGILALPFTIWYTAAASEEASRLDYPMLGWAVLMLGHLCLCFWQSRKPRERSS